MSIDPGRAADVTPPHVISTRVVGTRVLRLEDGPLVRGGGRFVDDLKFAHMLEAAFVRSPHAHAAIRRLDTGAAR